MKVECPDINTILDQRLDVEMCEKLQSMIREEYKSMFDKEMEVRENRNRRISEETMHYRIMKKDELDKYLPGFTRSRMYESNKSQIHQILGTIIEDRDAICCLNSNDAIVKFGNTEILSAVILKVNGCFVYRYHEWGNTEKVAWKEQKTKEKQKENTVKLMDKLFKRKKIMLRTDS